MTTKYWEMKFQTIPSYGECFCKGGYFQKETPFNKNILDMRRNCYFISDLIDAKSIHVYIYLRSNSTVHINKNNALRIVNKMLDGYIQQDLESIFIEIRNISNENQEEKIIFGFTGDDIY